MPRSCLVPHSKPPLNTSLRNFLQLDPVPALLYRGDWIELQERAYSLLPAARPRPRPPLPHFQECSFLQLDPIPTFLGRERHIVHEPACPSFAVGHTYDGNPHPASKDADKKIPGRVVVGAQVHLWRGERGMGRMEGGTGRVERGTGRVERGTGRCFSCRSTAEGGVSLCVATETTSTPDLVLGNRLAVVP